jgi:diguanylate cyclase (GGDEF)-like protein/PAS domain S-box-containing protein
MDVRASRFSCLLMAALVLLLALGPAGYAAAPVALDRDVSDITPWLTPAKVADLPSADKSQWLEIELANATNKPVNRVITVKSGGAGVFQFLSSSALGGLTEAAVAGEGGEVALIDVGGGRAAQVHIKPLARATIRLRGPSMLEGATWSIWKPEVLTARKQADTLTTGILAGATLIATIWLAGLAFYHRTAQPAWGALALGALVVLLLAGQFLTLSPEALVITGATMVAAGIRFLTTYLGMDYDRKSSAIFFDGVCFAIFGFALSYMWGVTPAHMVLMVLTIVGTAIATVYALVLAFGSPRAKLLAPGVGLGLASFMMPGLVSGELAQAATLAGDALFTAGMLALGFVGGIPHDHTEKDRIAEALSADQRKARETEYRYALGLAAAHQGLWDWNFESDTLFVSPSVEALLGLEAGAIGNSERKWAQLIAPEDVQLYADSINAHRRQGNSSFTLEMRMRHAKGGLRWIKLRASCMANPQGKAVRCIGLVSDVTGRKAQESQRQTDAAGDPVTGLMLRNAFLARLETVLNSMRSGQSRRQGAVLAIDVDRLRAITDSMGHQAGDRFLTQIARRLDHAAGPDDAVARLGSDEFAVLVMGSPGDEDGAQVAQRIRDALTQPVAINDREIYPAASIGLALIDPGHRYAGDALREAEIAMYHAKRAGRGGFEIYQPQMKPRSADRLIMDTDLRTALNRQEIELHYQPIIRLHDGSIAGFEALMRWRHPSRGLLSPGEFIAVAEETGLIVPLGRYAVERATLELKRWQSYFPMNEPIFCSVNVSARQLFRQEFFDDVVSVLRKEKPARLSLKLELTESVIMQNPDSTARALARLKEAGAGLALDDFGTGFSSLAYLQRFPFDTVKIDRSFVTDMAHNEETPVILRSIVRLAHDLDMSVVAEGVETQSEATRLKSLNCEFAQGYLFGAPMDATAAYNFIALNLRGQTGPHQPTRQASGPTRIPR